MIANMPPIGTKVLQGPASYWIRDYHLVDGKVLSVRLYMHEAGGRTFTIEMERFKSNFTVSAKGNL